MLEVLVAMLIVELGTLALADLFLTSTRMAHQVEQQLRMLYALRGEMERLEKTPLLALPSFSARSYDDFLILIQVEKYDEDKNGTTDYRKISVIAYPDSDSEVRRLYEFDTYRSV